MRPTGITVATYNLFLGADLSRLFGEAEPDQMGARAAALWSSVEASRPVERMRAAAAVIIRRLPDVVAVQEAALWRAGAGGVQRTHDLLDSLLLSLREQGVAYHVAARTDSYASGPLSTALREVTGQVVEFVDRSAILVRDDPAVSAMTPSWRLFDDRLTVRVLGRPVDVVRGWCAVDVRIGGSLVRVVDVHLEAFDAAVRAAQAHQLVAEELDGPRPAPLLVLGDLSCRPPACRSSELAGLAHETDDDAYERLTATGLVDAWGDIHPDAVCGGGTSGRPGDLRDPTAALTDRTDVVLVDPQAFTVRRAEVLGGDRDDRTPSGLRPSDHGCLVVQLDV